MAVAFGLVIKNNRSCVEAGGYFFIVKLITSAIYGSTL